MQTPMITNQQTHKVNTKYHTNPLYTHDYGFSIKPSTFVSNKHVLFLLRHIHPTDSSSLYFSIFFYADFFKGSIKCFHTHCVCDNIISDGSSPLTPHPLYKKSFEVSISTMCNMKKHKQSPMLMYQIKLCAVCNVDTMSTLSLCITSCIIDVY